MDQTFVKLVEIWEKWNKSGMELPALLLMDEIIQYGTGKGLLKDRGKKGVEDKESDESLMFRAALSSSISLKMLGEDLGFAVRMTREQHERLIRDTDALVEATMRQYTEILDELEKKPAVKH
ncbi:MAG: hypothetical protein G01um101470_841 [Parcubacteria group bacterium Gr01-1014_70]|nr:MAG: hypothetical protein G01um101470_841 [Parcubacteria group bacterium Gr01-1014_70]